MFFCTRRWVRGSDLVPLHTLALAFCSRDTSVRILLIEDHKPLVRALKQGLEEEGFAVDTALDGEEGNFKARSADYDVIILDLMLPKQDALSLLQAWRTHGLKTHVPVLTARHSPVG